MKNLSIAFLAAAVTNAACANWDPVSRADDGTYYTGTDSTNTPNNWLGLYADPTSDCSVNILLLEMDQRADIDDLDNVPIRVEMKVDQRGKWTNDGAMFSSEHNWDTGFTTFRVWQSANVKFLVELIEGDELIARGKPQQGSWSATVRYSLQGSQIAIPAMMKACREHNEWGDPEWTS